ncbi:hypothetical protein [Kitasatospora sp. NPDC088548]|uniref:hypothetical protein n=1 Tax=Kitasatospora sp. NPDC088548 TaxID=3364075 RepID=UPI0037F7A6E4
MDTMLQRGDVDMAVHCVKDVPGDVPLPRGLVFAAYMARPDVRDVLLFPDGSEYQSLADLRPRGSRAAGEDQPPEDSAGSDRRTRHASHNCCSSQVSATLTGYRPAVSASVITIYGWSISQKIAVRIMHQDRRKISQYIARAFRPG